MKLVIDELGMSSLITESMNDIDFTLLRFPYTTFLCSMSDNGDTTDKILRYQNITDPKDIKDIIKTAKTLIDCRVEYPDHLLNTGFSALYCEEWFGEGKLRLVDRYFDSNTTLLFYQPKTKEDFIPVPDTASDRIRQSWGKPGICYFQHDHITSHVHCKIDGIEGYVLDAIMNKNAHLVANKIDRIKMKYANSVLPKNRRPGKGGKGK